MTQSALLDVLDTDLRALLETIRTQVLPVDPAVISRTADPKRWSALECFDHLNRSYADYLDKIELSIHKAKARQWSAQPNAEIRYNMVGREAIRWVMPGNKRRFKTATRYNPASKNKVASPAAVKSFLIHAEIRLLQLAREVDLNRAQVGFALLPIVKYRLGNLLEFMVRHGQRHTIQALDMLQQVA
jgi:hypothetical protein